MYQLERPSLTSKPVLVRAVSAPAECGSLEGRILVVEDNPITQLVTLAQLRELGCEPCAASFGSEALESEMGETFDLILLDCHLPDIDGYEIARTIRKLERGRGRRRVAIVAVTVDSYEECIDRCILAGIDGHLQKPTSIAALRDVLEKFLT